MTENDKTNASPNADPLDDPRFAAIESILMGQAPPPPEESIDIGNTSLSPALLATEFVIKSREGRHFFKKWLHDNKLFPKAVGDIELPEDALDRDLKVAINSLLHIELTAKYVQELYAQMEAESEQAGTDPTVPSA